MYLINTIKAYRHTEPTYNDNFNQIDIYDSTKLVDINLGKISIMMRYAGWEMWDGNTGGWNAKIWSITSQFITNSALSLLLAEIGPIILLPESYDPAININFEIKDPA